MHSALTPHDPGQGSIHSFIKHALLKAQSELRMHSGLHAGLFDASGPLHGSHIAN